MPFERWLYAWRVRLRTLLDRDRVDRELDDELRHHVALETEARRAQGLAPFEARRQALATLGGLESARHHVRETWFGAVADGLRRHLFYGCRKFRGSAAFTAAAVATLALGMGGTTAIATLMDGVMLRPLPVSEPGRLYRIGGRGRYDRHGSPRPLGRVLVSSVRTASGRGLGVRGRHRVRLGRLAVERPQPGRGRRCDQASARGLRHRNVLLDARRRCVRRPGCSRRTTTGPRRRPQSC